MRRFTLIDAAKDAIDAKQPKIMLGFEKNDNRSRVFWLVDDMDTFIDRFKTDESRYWHEYVLPYRPVKLYFDLDDRSRAAGWEDLIQRVIRTVETEINRGTLVCRRWDADTNIKHSCHLVFPEVWFDCPASLCIFAKQIYFHINRDPRMDINVYTMNNSFKSLRTPYSSSFKKNNPLVPHEGSREFDQGLFLESLLTYGSPIDAISITKANEKAGDYGISVSDEDPEKIEAMERIKSWIMKFWGVTKIYVRSELDKNTQVWVWLMSPSIYCPIQQKRHVSNNSMMRGKFVGKEVCTIETICLDTECGEWIVNLDFDWSKIAFPYS